MARIHKAIILNILAIKVDLLSGGLIILLSGLFQVQAKK
jgi:hypothetical protein